MPQLQITTTLENGNDQNLLLLLPDYQPTVRRTHGYHHGIVPKLFASGTVDADAELPQ